MAKREELLRSGRWFPDYEFEAQVRTVQALIDRVGEWSKEVHLRIEQVVYSDHGECAEVIYADDCHESVWADAAHTHAAIAAVAPLIEGMLDHEFGALRFVSESLRISSGHSRWSVEKKKFWDPRCFLNPKGKLERDLVKGTLQLLEAIGVSDRFPRELKGNLDAVFLFRNKALHFGFEWPAKKRASFRAEATNRGVSDRFQWATRDGEPWICYLSDQALDAAIDTAVEMEAAFRKVRSEFIGQLPCDTPPTWME